MTIRSLLRMSWQAVVAHPMRSFLTVLGVTWGIMAFMILMAYGDGFQRGLDLGLRYFGDAVVVVWNGQTSKQAGGQKSGRAIRQEKRDVEMIRQEATLIKNVSGEVFRRWKVSYEQRINTAGIRGVESCYGEMRGMFIQDGRFFTDEENRQMARVAVLGYEIKQRLFSQAPAVGREIKIQGIRFKVVGVLKKKIAINTIAIMTDTRYLSVMVWQPVSLVFEEEARKQFFTLMGQRHRFDPDDDKALLLHSFSEVKGIIDGLSSAIKVTVFIVGLITLCIGGMGVMNIMLLSVRSRTREIGTMRALGAKRRHVVAQMMVETFVMTLMGGALGYFLASAIAWGIGGIPFLSSMFEDPTKQGDIYLLVSGTAFFASLVVLGGVSFVFGLWPAVQAARLDPVEALRYE
jgi:putative ABC transport system permease protein